MNFDFSYLGLAPLSVAGYSVLEAGTRRFRVKHEATGRIFTVDKEGEYFRLYVCSPSIDGPEALGAFIMKTDLLRSVLLVIGCIKK